LAKPAWTRALRLKIDLWLARRGDLFIPYSGWTGNLLVNGPGVSRERVKPTHVGLDLSVWRYRARPDRPAGERVRILFVGGDFFRKGGGDLLTAFKSRLSASTELHIVTKTVLDDLPDNVHVYDDLNANDAKLADLYQLSDLLAHPTRADLSSWVVLEALPSGCTVITTPVGGIPDLVADSVTGLLVQPGNPEALADAIEKLVADPDRRREMASRARRVVEEQFDAQLNVPRILQAMKDCVHEAQARSATPH
jgi:glycosyltransferase involved in cell wall biosynthesis